MKIIMVLMAAGFVLFATNAFSAPMPHDVATYVYNDIAIHIVEMEVSHYINNKEIIISEDESEIGDRIIELFSNEQFYKNISSNARKLIEEKYDWKRITQRLEEVYKTVVN